MEMNRTLAVIVQYVVYEEKKLFFWKGALHHEIQNCSPAGGWRWEVKASPAVKAD